MKSFRASFAIAASLLCTAGGCGNAPADPVNGKGGAGGAESTTPPPCPAGHVVQDDGSCLAIGIQGCAAKFVDADGICRPSMTKCADEPGTIPKFDTGCVPVGIPKADCAPEFWDAAEGLCRPTMAKCADKPGTFAVPSLGCVAIDGPDGCGVGTWGNIVDGPDVRYVDQNYAGQTSDGTKDKPFKKIAAAVSAAPNGGTVAIALGVYEENIVISKPLTIEGRCASMVNISGPTPNLDTIHVTSSNAVLRNLTVGGKGNAVYGRSTSNVLVEQVHIDQATGNGIYVDTNSDLTVRSSLVEHTQSLSNTLTAGTGIFSAGASKIVIEKSTVYENRMAGIGVFLDPTQCTVQDCLVENTLPQESDSLLGIGIATSYKATIDVKNTAFVHNHSAGLLLCCEASGTATNNLIETTQIETVKNDFGVGININTSAIATIVNNALVENDTSGMYVTDDATAHTRGNWITRSVAPSGKRFGLGMYIYQSRVDSMDDVIYQNHSAGIFAFDGSVFSARRLLVEDTQPHPETGQDGAGLGGYLNTRFDIEGSAFLNNVVTGIGVAYSPVQVNPMSPVPEPSRIRNSLVSNTKAGNAKQQDGTIQTDFGDGIVAVWGGDLDVERTIVEKNARAGFFYYRSTGAISQCEARENAVGVNLSLSESVTFDPLKNSIYTLNKNDVQIDGEMAMPPQMTGE